MQVDSALSGKSLDIRYFVGTTGPGSITTTAGYQEVNSTSQPVSVGETGWVIFHPSVTPANSVRPGTFRCTTAGTAIISWHNPTAGALTPTAPTATTPYLFLVLVPGV